MGPYHKKIKVQKRKETLLSPMRRMKVKKEKNSISWSKTKSPSKTPQMKRKRIGRC